MSVTEYSLKAIFRPWFGMWNTPMRLASGGRVSPKMNKTHWQHRSAILLIGGDKTGDTRWYETTVPVADRLYGEHLEQLRREGLIDG